MNNNDIFKKLRVALQLRDEQILDILQLVDFRISKGEIGNFFRNEDHPKFVECGDQVLRNFLNGLVIHLRGTKENPKNAAEVIDQNRKALATQPKDRFPKDLGTKNGTTGSKPAIKKPFKSQGTAERSGAKSAPARGKSERGAAKKIEVVEKVKFNNGKHKKK